MSLAHGISSTGEVVPLRVSATGALELSSTTLTNVQDVAEKSVVKAAATMVNNQVAFTIAGGPIAILDLLSECITSNDITASTLQWRSNPTVGTATTISGATTTLASIAAGATIRLAPTALTTAPVISLAAAGGVQLGTNVANLITVQPGTIQMVIAIGSTTGTWKHFLRYAPLGTGVTVS